MDTDGYGLGTVSEVETNQGRYGLGTVSEVETNQGRYGLGTVSKVETNQGRYGLGTGALKGALRPPKGSSLAKPRCGIVWNPTIIQRGFSGEDLTLRLQVLERCQDWQVRDDP
ncbi:hypothetical protein MAR_035010 [Mya arenaria]|uniref:Uncharacterized protein n=1 Tax=Mya arenaria TaxID=6604 RepID=A0ABY7ENG7_MYAAR|nr:hypothetical protein MAR_035010 [Mya arenaria]